MDNNKYTCGICGATITGLDEYMKHVAKCTNTLKEMQKKEQNQKCLEELNAAINKVKSAKEYYETCLREFKAKYPDEYEINFGSNTKEDKTTADEEAIKELEEDEYVDFMKWLLGI